MSEEKLQLSTANIKSLQHKFAEEIDELRRTQEMLQRKAASGDSDSARELGEVQSYVEQSIELLEELEEVGKVYEEAVNARRPFSEDEIAAFEYFDFAVPKSGRPEEGPATSTSSLTPVAAPPKTESADEDATPSTLPSTSNTINGQRSTTTGSGQEYALPTDSTAGRGGSEPTAVSTSNNPGATSTPGNNNNNDNNRAPPKMAPLQPPTPTAAATAAGSVAGYGTESETDLNDQMASYRHMREREATPDDLDNWGTASEGRRSSLGRASTPGGTTSGVTTPTAGSQPIPQPTSQAAASPMALPPAERGRDSADTVDGGRTSGGDIPRGGTGAGSSVPTESPAPVAPAIVVEAPPGVVGSSTAALRKEIEADIRAQYQSKADENARFLEEDYKQKLNVMKQAMEADAHRKAETLAAHRIEDLKVQIREEEETKARRLAQQQLQDNDEFHAIKRERDTLQALLLEADKAAEHHKQVIEKLEEGKKAMAEKLSVAEDDRHLLREELDAAKKEKQEVLDAIDTLRRDQARQERERQEILEALESNQAADNRAMQQQLGKYKELNTNRQQDLVGLRERIDHEISRAREQRPVGLGSQVGGDASDDGIAPKAGHSGPLIERVRTSAAGSEVQVKYSLGNIADPDAIDEAVILFLNNLGFPFPVSMQRLGRGGDYMIDQRVQLRLVQEELMVRPFVGTSTRGGAGTNSSHQWELLAKYLVQLYAPLLVAHRGALPLHSPSLSQPREESSSINNNGSYYQDPHHHHASSALSINSHTNGGGVSEVERLRAEQAALRTQLAEQQHLLETHQGVLESQLSPSPAPVGGRGLVATAKQQQYVQYMSPEMAASPPRHVVQHSPAVVDHHSPQQVQQQQQQSAAFNAQLQAQQRKYYEAALAETTQQQYGLNPNTGGGGAHAANASAVSGSGRNNNNNSNSTIIVNTSRTTTPRRVITTTRSSGAAGSTRRTTTPGRQAGASAPAAGNTSQQGVAFVNGHAITQQDLVKMTPAELERLKRAAFAKQVKDARQRESAAKLRQ